MNAANTGAADFEGDLMIKHKALKDPLCVCAEECMSREKWSLIFENKDLN